MCIVPKRRKAFGRAYVADLCSTIRFPKAEGSDEEYIYDYFKESTTDKIDDAMDELGDDYTEDEIRLVRIKFISEMAN